MPIEFKPAVRGNEHLIIGLIGGTGSGKTFTGLELAAGLTPTGKKFAMIDTEAGRGLHYADYQQFANRYDHADLRAPFRPDTYREAIFAAEDAGYPVIMVDSCSHEWAGAGGVIDWQEEELDRMAGDDWKKRESCKMAAWIKPKMAHKQMVQKLLQLRAHLILCFRAEEKVDIVKEDGKTKIVPAQRRTGLNGWVPICEKHLPFELTCSFLFTEEAPGFPKPIKLEGQHRKFFPLDQPVDRESGRLLAEWAANAPKINAPSQDQVASLIKLYETCDASGFAKLETDRKAWWSMIKPQQAVLKTVSDQARARLGL
jgi:hypothetical protein